MTWRTLAAPAAALAAVAIYAGTIGHQFVFDDGPEVVDNEAIRSLTEIPRLFAQTAWAGAGDDNGIYRPLTTATYSLNHAVSGLAPWSYHLGNVLLHALATLLVFALARQVGLGIAPSFVASVAFAIHPVHVEAVANVAGRKELLVAVFGLVALLAHGRAVRGGRGWLIAAPLAVAATLFSKETGLALGGVLVAHDLLFERDTWRTSRNRMVGLYCAYALIAAGYVAARWTAVGSLGVPVIPFVENPIARSATGARVATAIAVLGRGLQLLVVPWKLSPDYSYDAIPVTSASDPYLWLGVLLVGAAAATVAWSWRRAPVVAFGVLWYALTIFPASNLLVPIGTIFGERLLYVPSVGFCLLVGVVYGGLEATRGAIGLRWVTAAILVLLGVRTVSYAAIWRDELSLFTWGVEAQPRSSKMRQSLGGTFMEHGRPADAIEQFAAAVEIAKSDPDAAARHRLELGVALERTGAPDRAAALYEQILRERPDYTDARWRLGVVRWAQGRRAEAVAEWNETVRRDPRHARAWSDLGIAASLAGDAGAARAYWERAVSVDRRLASAWYRLGHVYERAGEIGRARAAWSEFLRHAGSKFPREREEVERKLRGDG